jgi:protein gp37
MALTSIEWTATLAPDGKLRAGYTFNPWWGCIRVSPGCEHCYAESQAKRYGHDIWGPASTTPRRFFGDKHWSEPLKWNRDALALGMRLKVFCASFADVFEDNDSLIPHRERLWEVIAETPQLDWLVLTKRPENIHEMMPDRFWPNVWLGTSAENQHYYNTRVPILIENTRRVPVLFVSAEPLLGPIDLSKWLSPPRYDPVDGGDEVRREHRLSGGGIGRGGDRRSGESLASSVSPGRSVGRGHEGHSVQTSSGGALGADRLLAGASDVQGQENLRPGASPGVQAFLWADTEGHDGQSPERSKDGQSARKPFVGNERRTDQALHERAEAGPTQSVWRTEPMARLTVQQVVEIRHRRLSGESLNVLAEEFGVRFQHISRIARGDRRSLG